ncbi:hypothetical protein H6P81_004855 [Aristolochia fimbriata]|uniref:DUSP domain-containing protein n=1 Tax=Aristolochia fimbriata TaxID=158543 RepID=A0AAV7EWD3_ARIFI|nr:hypothetical protein H6P81_004855 [Aristolochia fimbriata]
MAIVCADIPISVEEDQLQDIRKEERETIEQLSQTTEREGHVYYLLSCRWWRDWERYVGLAENAHPVHKKFSHPQHLNAEIAYSPRPGPIDNSGLAMSQKDDKDGEQDPCKPLTEGVDYILVSQEVWEKLFEWYNGGPAIPRKRTMNLNFQTATLVASPSYPNSVVWSEENLVAVASGRLITIMNPSSLLGPRGLIKISKSSILHLGLVEKEDLLAPCLLPTSISREENQPSARSISWSHPGLASNSGCLLAVCATDGSVKLYRQPFCEFSSEWVEVADITALLYDYYSSINFSEHCSSSSCYHKEQMTGDYFTEPGSAGGSRNSELSVMPEETSEEAASPMILSKRKRGQVSEHGKMGKPLSAGKKGHLSGMGHSTKSLSVFTDETYFPCSVVRQGSLVEVFKDDGSRRFWVSGKIKCIEGAKAQVLFPEMAEDGVHVEWLDLNLGLAESKDSSVFNGVAVQCDPVLPTIRPAMDIGNLPHEIMRPDCHGVQEVLKIGVAVEARQKNRWIEGVLRGFNRRGLLVKLPGQTRCITVDPTLVRLAPVWKDDKQSWHTTPVKIAATILETSGAAFVKSKMACVTNLDPSFENSNCIGKQVGEDDVLPVTAKEYAFRLAMLQSVIVAWSPILGPSPDSPSNCCAVLAVGGKSGKISFWRVLEPQYYTIECGKGSVDVMLTGLLQAHNSWITALSWGLYDHDAANRKFVLATGGCDGSVKIWHGDVHVLLKSSLANGASFSLLKEVSISPCAPVSTMSIVVPPWKDKIFLAVGRGSGYLEVSSYDISGGKFKDIQSLFAHDQAITGLAWAVDGCCLYSCGQDNCVWRWVVNDAILREASFSSGCHNNKGPNFPLAFDACFGLALSPGNLVVAVVRSCDVDLLNPMYQARAQKAAVEFFWTGGQYLQVSLGNNPNYHIHVGFPSQRELSCWECNILRSLKQLEDMSKLLALWDVIAALTAFSRFAPDFVEHVPLKWLSHFVWHSELSVENILLHVQALLSKSRMRHMHLLNIICRRVMLNKVVFDFNELWSALLSCSERELRGRLVAYTFSTVSSHVSSTAADPPSETQWFPVGVSQMEQWVATGQDLGQEQNELLTTVLRQHRERTRTISDHITEEKCSFCCAIVPFESPEFAFCKGKKCNGGRDSCHKLNRCAVSMQICPLRPLWFCMCCERWISKLAPQGFFSSSVYPLDFNFRTDLSYLKQARPFCPFCGILLRRFLPDFLLSPDPV